MTRYHLNPETGEPGICQARKSCPFGLPIEDHYSSKDLAQKDFERVMTGRTITSIKNDYPLEQAFDLDLLKKMVREGYVYDNNHPEDPDLHILCYTRNAQYAGLWNEVTKQARGLIIRYSDNSMNDAIIEQRPWRKFFTLSQLESGWALGDEENTVSAEADISTLDFNAKAEVTDKMDGSLGILYVAPDGLPAFSTKASFASDQALYYTNMLRKDEARLDAISNLIQNHPDKTFLFELVGKDNRIVLQYDEDDTAFLGSVRKSDGLYYSTQDFKEEWADKGFTVAESMPAQSVTEAFNLPHRKGREGVVVRILSDTPEKQFQIKIKQDDYLKLHKLMTNFSMKNVRDTVRETKVTYKDLIESSRTGNLYNIPSIKDTIFVEELKEFKDLQELREKRFNDLVLPVAKDLEKGINYVKAIPQEKLSGDKKQVMKDFVLGLPKDLGALERDIIFKTMRARLNNEDIENYDASNIMNTIASRGFDKNEENI